MALSVGRNQQKRGRQLIATVGAVHRYPPIGADAIWHPRLDQDPAHRWLRAEVLNLCRAAYPQDRFRTL